MRTSRTPARSARHVGFSKIHVFPSLQARGNARGRPCRPSAARGEGRRTARLRALSDELAAADRASRVGTVELALVETPETATAESYHEVPAPAGAKIRALSSRRK